MEQTLVILKPDALEKRLIGTVIDRMEKKGFTIQAMRMLWMNREDAEEHYAEHRDKSFFSFVVEYISRKPVVVLVVAGQNAVEMVRTMVGATDPQDAAPGTIRGDLALDLSGGNIIHASDSLQSAEREIAFFFGEDEIYEY